MLKRRAERARFGASSPWDRGVEKRKMRDAPRILIIAGSDSGAGAGIQADLKTASALGAYACTVLTAVTAQNTRGVTRSMVLPADLVEAQVRAVLSDLGADAIKLGMLGDRQVAGRIADLIEELAGEIPVVIDPVLSAKGGAELFEEAGRELLLARLFPLAALVTPNSVEAGLLLGREVIDRAGAAEAARDLVTRGARAALVKGGHLDGDRVTDLLHTDAGLTQAFSGRRILTRSSHGTGCTLATAISVGLARGWSLPRSIELGRAFVREALRSAGEIGEGQGPMNHAAAGVALAGESARSGVRERRPLRHR